MLVLKTLDNKKYPEGIKTLPAKVVILTQFQYYLDLDQLMSFDLVFFFKTYLPFYN